MNSVQQMHIMKSSSHAAQELSEAIWQPSRGTALVTKKEWLGETTEVTGWLSDGSVGVVEFGVMVKHGVIGMLIDETWD